jgi:isoleucyl-tRNA synthetase
MQRVPEVIDCWYDSGSMPFAQWGYPHANRERFEDQFPADFHQRGHRSDSRLVLQLAGDQHDAVRGRAELRDQSIGGRAGAGSCASLPASVQELHRAGPDAGRRRREDVQEQAELPRAVADLRPLRRRRAALVLLRQPAALDSIRYSEQAIKDSIPEFLLRLWNVYSFFVIYANIDGFDPAARLPARPAS